MQESDNLAVVVAFLSGFLGAIVALLVLAMLAFVLFALPQDASVHLGQTSAASSAALDALPAQQAEVGTGASTETRTEAPMEAPDSVQSASKPSSEDSSATSSSASPSVSAADALSHKATLPTLESIGLSSDDYITGDFNARVEECLQFPELPGGCEIAAMTSVLRALGFDTDLVAFTDDYVLKVEGEPELVYSYSGSPYDRGAAFPPAMARAGNAYLKDQDSPWRFVEPKNATIDELVKVVATGRPVLLWTTMYAAAPEFASITIEGYEWYNNEHCVVFFGLSEDGNMQIMDPLAGITTQDRKKFEEVYTACGQLALVLSQTQTDLVDAAEAQLAS